ncbi:YgaP family membrane protein [Thiohalomonas denitrificans]|uniref:YgaP family membrane protein n=1 Tax=Thiohalomonas denitrificans TaxID=415747 RepID=UPI0026F2BA95|nr:DUF2892 domain-containing protein [Thiohalomonas denitrificans]
MKCNVGGADRTIRIVLGIVLLAIGLFYPLSTLWQTLALIVGAIGVVTGLVRFCPANALLGINTCQQQKQSH